MHQLHFTINSYYDNGSHNEVLENIVSDVAIDYSKSDYEAMSSLLLENKEQ